MNQVVKDNALINASYSLELVEQRIVLQAIIKARETEKGFDTKTPLSIHASEYEKQYNVTKDAAYKALKDAVLSLFERQFTFTELQDEKLKVVKSRWVSQIAYVDKSAEVQIIFSPAVASMCSRLERHFTSYDLEQVAPLTSKYAVRLYELMMSWKSVGKTPIIKLSEFRERVGLLDENEYKDMCTFKKYVLDLAVAQINEHTDIKLTYEQHKAGRKIDGFSFKFKQKVKQQKIEQPQRDQNTPDLFNKMTDPQRHLFGSKLAHDARVQSEYSHLVGTGTYEQFGKLLADMLAEEKHFKTFYPLLAEYGFKG
ncbi:replication initiation protein RepM [Acinetobacter sp. YH12131]|uniref:replication initiation protein RepM n=1 Tax=Acinetobacter sp. YH12131 TaxID=2601115 RepID=UPI0015D19A58|nr:replication initiation protein RepM [Acinetobacter sp. YH12131]